MVKTSVKTKDGLPEAAFAVAGEPDETSTWHFPHHRKSVMRALRGKAEIEETVDWPQMEVVMQSLYARRRHVGIEISPEEVLKAARHLAGHFRFAGKPLPDVLAALV